MPNPSLLVVDDDPAVKEAVQAGLRLDGYDLMFASNGVEAITLVGEVFPELRGTVQHAIMTRNQATYISELLNEMLEDQLANRIIRRHISQRLAVIIKELQGLAAPQEGTGNANQST